MSVNTEQNSFLWQAANAVLDKFGDNVSDLIFVFPNKRAGIFFLRNLARQCKKPFWSPQVKSIGELLSEFSGLSIADNITLVFELHKIYNQIKKSNETIDDFYYWGEMLIADFDDIDKYRVTAADLFKNLRAVKEIDSLFGYLSEQQVKAIKDFWSSFDDQKLSHHQSEFISLWEILSDVYTEFKKHLIVKGIAYEGMIYRIVADKCKSGNLQTDELGKIVFIGFNALNDCEKQLFDYLQKKGKAEFIWDYDEYYIENKHNEAGRFLRENIKNYSSGFRGINYRNLKSDNKKIDIISVSSDNCQAKIAGEIVNSWDEANSADPAKSAIVLSDENLLLPVLYSIPDGIGKVNITMGYPVNLSGEYSLLISILEMQNSLITKESIYYKHVLKIINNEQIKRISPKDTVSISENIVYHNRVYLNTDELQINEIYRLIFKKYSDTLDFVKSLLLIIEKTVELNNNIDNTNTVSGDFFYSIYLSLKRFSDIISSYSEMSSMKTAIRLIKQVLQNIKVPYEGEPLCGLQVMGILETRALDYENIVVLSASEGKLPKTGTGSSFIPYSLRRAFGMPTIEHQDSIYSYYFYRLIQRAKNITLIYNSSDSGGGSKKEMSRFLLQLKYEAGIPVSEKSVSFDISLSQKKEISIAKNEHSEKILLQYTDVETENKKYFSASALNTYIDCKLKFYFSYIAGLKESEDVSEEVEAAIYGTILHKALNILYKDFIGRQIQTSNLDALLNNEKTIEAAVCKAFAEDYFFTEKEVNKENLSGKSLIVFEIISKYCREIIKYDSKSAPLIMISSEEKYKNSINILKAGKNLNINLAGYIDRVDETGHSLRIIDFKTGGAERNFNGTASLFDSAAAKRPKAVFQAFFYCLLYESVGKGSIPVKPCLFYVRDIFNSDFTIGLFEKSGSRNSSEVYDYKTYSEEYKSILKTTLEDLYNAESDFCQTENLEICKYCHYSKICHRNN